MRPVPRGAPERQPSQAVRDVPGVGDDEEPPPPEPGGPHGRLELPTLGRLRSGDQPPAGSGVSRAKENSPGGLSKGGTDAAGPPISPDQLVAHKTRGRGPRGQAERRPHGSGRKGQQAGVGREKPRVEGERLQPG